MSLKPTIRHARDTILCALLSIGSSFNPAWAAKMSKTAPCLSSGMSLAEMSKADTPWSKGVPSDVEVEQKPYKFMVNVAEATAYPLPIKNPDVTAGILPSTYHETAACEIHDFHGNWWIAFRNIDGPFEYVLLSDTQPVP